MTEFFVLTDDAVLGPFTGVELREAAMAGVIGAESVIGGSVRGPWRRGREIGLFADDLTALPHPSGTPVLTYQLRDRYGAPTGPWKLRDLLELAANHSLSREDLVLPQNSRSWVSVGQIPILQACLAGEMVTINESGQFKPVHVNLDALTNEASCKDVANVSVIERARHNAQKHKQKSDVKRTRERFTRWRVAGIVIGLLAVLLWVVALWISRGTSRRDVIGRWVHRPERSQNGQKDLDSWTIGVFFGPDGQVVIYDRATGPWTGTFEWINDRASDKGVLPETGSEKPKESRTEKRDHEPEDAEIGPVTSKDGQVQFLPITEVSPKWAGRTADELFFRREGDTLWIGVPQMIGDGVSLHSTDLIQAIWIPMQKDLRDAGELQRDLVQLPVTSNPAEELRGRRIAPHISVALSVAREGVRVERGGKIQWRQESRADSKIVTRDWTLDRYGIPDEARPITVEDLPSDNIADHKFSAGGCSLRYGQIRLVFSAGGNLLGVAIVPREEGESL